MASSVHDQPTEVATATEPQLHWHYGRYLAVILLLPALVILLTFPFAGSQAFLQISRRSLWHAAQYRFVLPSRQNCDIVIAGDSSGMIGVDPDAIEAETGWKTCNIALPYVNTVLAGTRVLDWYLAHNKPPRFIVFHFGSNHLNAPLLNEDNGIVDGWLMVDEHFPLREKLHIFLTHPLDTLRFITAIWKEFLSTKPLLRPDWTGNAFRDDMHAQIRSRGWLAESGTNPEVVCGWQAPDFDISRSYLGSLISRYTRGGTRAVIWANPVRDCDNRIAQYQKNAATLDMPPTRVYPRALFFDAFHLNTEGAARNATELVRYLRSLKVAN